jgi:hypothetical protein
VNGDLLLAIGHYNGWYKGLTYVSSLCARDGHLNVYNRRMQLPLLITVTAASKTIWTSECYPGGCSIVFAVDQPTQPPPVSEWMDAGH